MDGKMLIAAIGKELVLFAVSRTIILSQEVTYEKFF